MVVYIVIAGEIQCELFAEICVIADYLCQKLPNFCYERIEKSVLEWPQWLQRVNLINNWHHTDSPIVWKELMVRGSKAFYIGGASEFLEYVHSYYNFDLFMSSEKYKGLVRNLGQYKKKVKDENASKPVAFSSTEKIDISLKNDFVVCISGAGCPLASLITSRLLDMAAGGEKTITKVFIFDEDCTDRFLAGVETQCSFLFTKYPGRVVKFADKIGTALTIADLLIVLDHVPFNPQKSIGEWLHANMVLMQRLAIMINASASRSMYIVLANLGPACFNATVLMRSVTVNIKNIVVATANLGLEVLNDVSEIYELPLRKIFCPAVWGFVGINHIVDLKTTIHQYNSFEPYTRFTKVKNSTLNIGKIIPEMRTLEYMMHFDESVWLQLAHKQKILPLDAIKINVGVAIANLIRVWLIEPTTCDYITSLGIHCDGSFGLTFDGAFSQPVRLVGREWKPATDFFMPKDNHVKLPYLQYIAEMMMKLHKTAMPPIVKSRPCKCKRIYVKKKGVW